MRFLPVAPEVVAEARRLPDFPVKDPTDELLEVDAICSH